MIMIDPYRIIDIAKSITHKHILLDTDSAVPTDSTSSNYKCKLVGRMTRVLILICASMVSLLTKLVCC